MSTTMNPMAALNVAVLGGLFVDHIMVTNRLPDDGETFPANSYHKALGGKGANAAVAAFRSSHRAPIDGVAINATLAHNHVDINVRMIAAAGEDELFEEFKQDLAAKGLDASALRSIKGKSTALSFVIVEEDSRQNRILSFAGANHALFPQDFTTAESLGNGVRPDLVICQLELMTETIEQVLETAHHAGIDVVFNAAPADTIVKDIYPFITHLLVNETEAAILSGILVKEIEGMSKEQWVDFAKKFVEEGIRNVVITLGAEGAVYANDHGAAGHVPATVITAVDPTGAGDTFTGVYAAEYLRQKVMHEDWDIGKAVSRGCRASALVVATLGAQVGIPWADQLEDMAVTTEAPKVGEVDEQAEEKLRRPE